MKSKNETKELKFKNYINFICLPLVALAFLPVLNDSTGLPKVIALLTGTLLLVLNNINTPFRISKYQLVPVFLLTLYGFNQIFLKITIESFLLGAFARNGGFISILCLTLIFIYYSNLKIEQIKYFINILFVTFYLLLLYGIIQILEILPIEETRNYGSLTLTLQNPNFASAFLGIAISCQIILVLEKKKYRIFHALILVVAVYELFQTRSIQGFLLIALGLVIYLVNRKDFRFNHFKFKIALSILPIVTVLAFNFTRLLDWLIVNGSVIQRLKYWDLALDIWKDHFLFGVGVDNMRDYSTLYKNLGLTQQEGVFTAPDRAHNVILDHFVNGGIFGGLFWIFFVITISFLALTIMIKTPDKTPVHYLIVIIIWFSYLLQSLISVDQLFLTLLGYSSAGIIVSIVIQKKLDQGVLVNQKKIDKLFGLFFIIILTTQLLFSMSIVKSEQNAYKFLVLNNKSVLVDLYESKYIQSKTLEDIAVKISQTKDFEIANKFATKLLIKKPYSHQAYYIKSVYYESTQNDDNAKKSMLEALRIDKYNSVYLLSMAIYEYKIGDINAAKDYLERAKVSNPRQQGLDLVEQMISS